MMSQVQWFPGHMTKAIRTIEAMIDRVDVVIECRDARAVVASRNPVLERLRKNKPRLIVLTKKDLAIRSEVERWIQYFREQGELCISVDVTRDPLTAIITASVQQLLADKLAKQIRRGIRPRAVRAMVVGIPNVGKSTLINRLAKRKALKVENRPGVTRALTLVKVNEQLEIIDSPGLLWPKFEDPEVGLHLAFLGSVKDSGYSVDDVAVQAVEVLRSNPVFVQRYAISSVDPQDIFAAVARRSGFVMAKGELDIQRAKEHILNQLANGQYGPMMWETVDAD